MVQDKTVAAQLSQLNDEQLTKLVLDLTPSDASVLLKQADQALVARLFAKLSPAVVVNLVNKADKAALKNLLIRAHPTHLTRVVPSISEETLSRLLVAAPSKRQQDKLISALPAKRRVAAERRFKSSAQEAWHEWWGSTASYSEKKSRSKNQEKAYEEFLMRAERERREVESRYSDLLKSAELERRLLQAKEFELQQKIVKLEESQSKQVQQRIETKVPEYVAAAVRLLEDREAIYRKKAANWSIQGSAVLLTAIVGTAALSLYGVHFGPALVDLSWQALLFVSFKGLVVLGVLGLWAKHAYTISNAYMHEAIKRSDRAHAINFGKLYLEIYGNAVERKELIDIFENWNISSDSAFSKANPSGFDPAVLDRLGDMLKTIKLSKGERSGE